MKHIFNLFFSITFFIAIAQDKPAYIIYNSDGQKANYTQMLETALKNDIVLFGELHNNTISHWLQLELTHDIFNSLKSNLVLGAEMFEADNQLIINEYLSKRINYRNFKAEARLWNNFETDYKPLLDFALKNNLKFIATNIPRRYASIVNNEGFEGLSTLSAEAKNWIAPLPVKYDASLPGYQKMLKMGGMQSKETNENFPKAQAIKDATMAHFIMSNFNKGQIFLHFHGAFHSDFYDGIYWYLKQTKPNIKIMTISTVEQNDINTLDNEYIKAADFIICVPEKMTKTY